MRILYTKKADGDQDTQSVISAFEEAETLEAVRAAVEQAQERLYATWASVEAKDADGEIIPVDDLIEQNAILMERGAPISDEHTNRIVGRTLAWKVLKHPETDTYGILHLNRIYDHNELDDLVWSEIQSGERGGSSVGGVSQGTTVQLGEDGKGVHRIEGFSWMETASTGSPVNPYATNEAFSVVAKSKTKPTPNYPKITVKRGFKNQQSLVSPTQQETIKMNDTNKRRVYLKPGQEAPAGATVQTGSGGGRYYETSGAGSNDASEESSPEATAMEQFASGTPAEEVIQSLVESGVDFETARAAAINAARDYANDPANQMQMDAPAPEEVDEFVSYLESLNAEDLNLEGTASEQAPAEEQPETGDAYDEYDTLTELYPEAVQAAVQHVKYDARAVAATDYAEQLEHDYGLAPEEAQSVMQAVHTYETTPSNNLSDGGKRRRLEMFNEVSNPEDARQLEDLKRFIDQDDREGMMREAVFLQEGHHDTALRDIATDIVTDNLRDEEAIRELASRGTEWNYEVVNRQRKQMGLEPINDQTQAE